MSVTLLADRGFEHGALSGGYGSINGRGSIRAKSDLNITLSNGKTAGVANLFPPEGEAYLFREVTVLQDIECHLATAHLALASEPWAVLSDVPPSLQSFEVYGQRFGGIEPHFKDYKSAAFELIRSHLRDPQALNCLLMLLAAATLIAIAVALVVVHEGRRKMLDWHSQRGLSFLQLGLREIKRLCYQRLPIPLLATLPRKSPPSATASLKKTNADRATNWILPCHCVLNLRLRKVFCTTKLPKRLSLPSPPVNVLAPVFPIRMLLRSTSPIDCPVQSG